MIIKKDTFKQQSEVECDMCKTKINSPERITIKVSLGNSNPKKKWDLCQKCYNKIKKAVENYYLRKNKKENINDTFTNKI